MQRSQLEHVIRASGAITGASDFVVIGSQAILGQFPHAPDELLASIEADVFSLRNPDDSDLIDGCIGEGSPFHQTFGYYAHGVAMETASLPAGWQERLVPIENPNTGGGRGLCLEVHDLAASKLAAGREKDVAFLRALLRHRLAQPDTIRLRLAQMELDPQQIEVCQQRLKRLTRENEHP